MLQVPTLIITNTKQQMNNITDTLTISYKKTLDIYIKML